MRAAEEIGRIIERSPPAERVLYFAALLAAESDIPGDDLVVVGGSAVEIYTRADYVSGDIDIVSARDVIKTLKRWGFRLADLNIWYHKEWKVAVDLVKSSLRDYTGSFERTKLFSTPYGSVRVEAVEDSLVRRLIQARHRRRPQEFDWALAVASEYPDSIDWEYAEKIARLDQVSDLLDELRTRLQRLGGSASRPP